MSYRFLVILENLCKKKYTTFLGYFVKIDKSLDLKQYHLMGHVMSYINQFVIDEDILNQLNFVGWVDLKLIMFKSMCEELFIRI